jgi:hypothetical protein
MPARAEQKIMQNRHEKEFNSPRRKYILKMRRNICEMDVLKIAGIFHTKNKPFFRDKNWEPL